MASEIDPKKVTKLAQLVKKNPGNSERWYSEQSGVAMPQILRYLCLAEIEADPSVKIKQTADAIVKARDVDGLRWPRIAARSGLSESKAKDLYESKKGAGSAAASYTGRGNPNPGGSGASSGRRSSASKKASSTSTGRGGTSGRRSSGTKKTSTRSSGSRGTRAQAKAADPS